MSVLALTVPRQGSPASQHGAFAGELPGGLSDDQRFDTRGRSEDLNFAIQHHEKRHGPLSDIDEDIKATSADLVADAKRIQEIETRKQHLDPGDPRADGAVR